MKDKMLITGGAGFVGSFLAEELLNRGYAVVAVDNLSTGRLENIAHLRNNTDFEFITGTIMDESLMDKLIGRSVRVFHLAAAVGTRCVGLHGTTRPERSGAHGPGHEHVQAFYQSGSSRQRRRAPNDAMQAIEVPMVMSACDRLLSQGPDRSSHAA